VVGFDDVELARYAGLTTVGQPLELSGARAAELLVSSLDGSEISTATHHLPLELVVRDTTAPPDRGRKPAVGSAAGELSG
jgi:DNA-binding LacI/PurR family transcriptional regulator